MQEIVGLLYVSLAIAAGGNDLLEESNDILRIAIERGSVSPDTRQALKALVAATSKKKQCSHTDLRPGLVGEDTDGSAGG
jgi:hypothetical protein